MGEGAARDVVNRINDLVLRQEFVNIIFAAAPSQNEFLYFLSRGHDADWSRVNAFHMDEYIGLKNDSPQRFGNFLKERFFDKVSLHSVHYLDGNAPGIEAECNRYSNLLNTNPTDIVCMGIGVNTHIAFNDPHVADVNDPLLIKKVELDQVCRQQQVDDGCFEDLDKVPSTAITLTIPALMRASYIYSIVPGITKSQAVYYTLNSEVNEKYPSTILRRHLNAILYLDLDSSSGIDNHA
jgi:glucosamine-6-phosphate deaminase